MRSFYLFIIYHLFIYARGDDLAWRRGKSLEQGFFQSGRRVGIWEIRGTVIVVQVTMIISDLDHDYDDYDDTLIDYIMMIMMMKMIKYFATLAEYLCSN